MKFMSNLRYKFGKYAIRNLMLYIVSLNLAVFILMYITPELNIFESLILVPDLVMKGEVWRLISYIFIPPNFSLVWILFSLYFYYILGTGLEREWGSFNFNLYYFIGIIGTTASAFISGYAATGIYLNMSLLLAFACIYPDHEFTLYFAIPVKAKYFAWLDAILLGNYFIKGDLSVKLAVAAAMINFLLFFGKDLILSVTNRGSVYKRRIEYKSKLPKKTTYHRCTVCGITEEDDNNMEFRYCSTCEGRYEYCMVHLKNHEHIKK